MSVLEASCCTASELSPSRRNKIIGGTQDTGKVVITLRWS